MANYKICIVMNEPDPVSPLCRIQILVQTASGNPTERNYAVCSAPLPLLRPVTQELSVLSSRCCILSLQLDCSRIELDFDKLAVSGCAVGMSTPPAQVYVMHTITYHVNPTIDKR